MAATVATGDSFSVDCRGFGHVDVEVSERAKGVLVTEFSLGDAKSAMRLASKRMNDLMGYGDLRRERSSSFVASLVDVGAWCVGVRGSQVYEAFAPTAKQAETEVTKRGAMPPDPRAYPRYLDCFDGDAAALWIACGGKTHDVPFEFAYLKDLGLAFCAAKPGVDRLVGPGLVDFSPFDWQRTMAELHGLGYRQLQFGAGVRQSWLFNEDPLPYAEGPDGFLDSPMLFRGIQNITGYYEPVGRERWEWDFRRQLAQRYGDEESPLLGWHGCDEIPTATIVDLASVARSPYVERLWQKDHQGAVPVPEDFLGGGRKLDLRGIWEMRSAEDSAWFRAPANDMAILIHRTNAKPPAAPKFWMRRTFEAPGDSLTTCRYLHAAVTQIHRALNPPPEVTVNGMACPRVAENVTWSYCYDVGRALRPGRNEIAVQTWGSNLPGYFFLNATPLRGYLDMTPTENARFFEAIEFSTALRIRLIEGNLRAIRSVDPERPIKLMATHQFYDKSLPLCRRYGAYQHDTGGAGAFWAPMQGDGYSRSHRLPFSCEQGGPPADVAALRSSLTRYLNYGNSAADLVFSVQHYTENPEIRAWLEENVELLHALGKMRQPSPRLAVLRSSRMFRIGLDDIWNWDIGRGLVQSTGRTLSYVETCDLTDPSVLSQFNLIVDDASLVLTEDECAGLRRWIEAGGTFVAQHHTGRHSVAERDTWPLWRVLGIARTDAEETVTRLGKGRVIRFGVSRRAFDRERFVKLFDEMELRADCVSATERFWGESFETKNGIYDLYLSSFMTSLAGRENLELRESHAAAFACPAKPVCVRDFGVKGHPAVESKWKDGILTLPVHDYVAMESKLYAVPHADPGRAAVRWIRAFAETWHPVEKVRWNVPEPRQHPDYLPLAEDWQTSGGRTVRLGSYATMGFRGNEDVTLTRKVKIPEYWRGREVTLVYDAPFWFAGLAPLASLKVNGRPASLKQPMRPDRSSSFSFPVTKDASGGELELSLSIMPSQVQGWGGFSSGTPTGSLGMFYLHCEPKLLSRRVLDGPWFACTAYGERIPVKTGEGRPHTYYETEFNWTPRDGERVIFRYGEGLTAVVVNGRAVELDGLARTLDVSRLLVKGLNNIKVFRRADRLHNEIARDAGKDLSPLAAASIDIVERSQNQKGNKL